MNTTIISKFTLYDILVMVIPGGSIYLMILWVSDKCELLPEMNTVLDWTIGLVLSYLIGMVNHSLTAFLWRKFRNRLDMIECARKKAIIPEDKKKNERNDTEIEYYKAYYYAAKHRYSDDIFIMERQVAFMQNMIVPLVLALLCYGCYLASELNHTIWKVVILIIVAIALTVISLHCSIKQRQKKIYRRVWEDNHYLRGSE